MQGVAAVIAEAGAVSGRRRAMTEPFGGKESRKGISTLPVFPFRSTSAITIPLTGFIATGSSHATSSFR